MHLAVAKVVRKKPSHLSSVSTHRELHRLPIQWRVKFKLASLAFKAMHTDTSLASPCSIPSFRRSRVIFLCWPLTSSHTNLTFGFRSLRAAAPTIWNSLLDSVRSRNTFSSSRRQLETHPFQAAFNIPCRHTPAPPIHSIHVTDGAL